VLVIDEMQHLKMKYVGGEASILRFIHNLVNNLGVPVFFCGNPPFDELLSKTLKAGRRAENGGYFEMELMENDEVWAIFVEELWQLQWTNVLTPLSPMLKDKLHYLCAGNLDLAVRIYKEAQRYIMGESDERITGALLEHASSIASRASAPAISLLRRSGSRANKTAEPEPVILSEPEVATPKPVPGDLLRVQHIEFSSTLAQLQQTDDLHSLIADLDLFQRASGEDNPLEPLKKVGILCENPLERFA
jgi:hypothetical protein